MNTNNTNGTPANFTFKQFLRIVVGETVASARTETDRVEKYRRFLKHVYESSAKQLVEHDTRAALSRIPKSIERAIAERIAEIKRDGVDAERLEREKARFKEWYPTLLSERGRAGAKKRWEKRKTIDKARKGRK